MIYIDRSNPHKQKFFEFLNTFEEWILRQKHLWTTELDFAVLTIISEAGQFEQDYLFISKDNSKRETMKGKYRCLIILLAFDLEKLYSVKFSIHIC